MEFYELTLKEVFQMIDAYEQREIRSFNFNTRMIGWQLEKGFSGKAVPFNSFWNIDEEDINKVGSDLQAQAEYMRAKLRANGFLKEKN